MNKKLIEDFKNKLVNQKEALTKELRSFATEDKSQKNNWDAKYPNREDSSMEEEADEVQEYDNRLSLEHSLELRLRDVDIALEKIENNKYGICEKCGKEIDESRLQACPEARTCVKCKK
ncbi:MAG: TraR/DksA family transcriptional regulator [Candidatus Staskawiczbacteria bacterium]|nr:TraR/DksA family transcriptional regulator [Candidatus Staskawiczbacteria bacterium]